MTFVDTMKQIRWGALAFMLLCGLLFFLPHIFVHAQDSGDVQAGSSNNTGTGAGGTGSGGATGLLDPNTGQPLDTNTSNEPSCPSGQVLNVGTNNCEDGNGNVIGPATGTGGSAGSSGGSAGGTGGSAGSSGGSASNPGGVLINPIGETTVQGFLLKVIDVILIFLLPIIILFIMYAGYLFVTATGEAAKIETARSALLWAVVGGVIVLGAHQIIKVIQGTIAGF